MGSRISPQPRHTQRQEMFGPVVDSCFLVRWLRIHCFYNLVRTLWRPLTKKDFFNTTPQLMPEPNYRAYQEIRRQRPTYGFCRTIFFSQFLCVLLIASLIAMVAAGLNYAGPLFLKQILKFINNKKANKEDQNRAYLFAGIWVLCYFIRIMLDQLAQWNCFAVSIKVEQIMHLAIYDKMVKMSSSHRKLFDEGDFMTFFTIDSKIITNFVKVFYVLFSAPTTLILAQIFLFIETGVYGLIMTGVVIVSIVFQIFICRRVAINSIKKFNHFQDRISANIEMFSCLKQIKSLGWEEIITTRNQKLRANENRYNRKIFLYQSLYGFVVSFAPALTIFLVLAIDLAVKGTSQFEATHVFILISYISLIYGPLNNLPSAIVASLQTHTSARRMDKLFEMEEMEEVSHDEMKPGHVSIRNYIGMWANKDKNLKSAPSSVNCTTTQPASGNLLTPADSLWNLNSHVELSDTNFQIKIPYTVNLKQGDRLIVLGNNLSGKSSFFHAILGSLHSVHGQLQVGGKIGYVSQIPYLRRKSIKENILFGQKLDSDRFEMAKSFVCLTEELSTLEKGDDTILQDINTLMSPITKQKISLARAIYYNPDVYLFDDIFTSMDIKTVELLITKFEKVFPNKTMIIATNLTSIIRPDDQVMIFDKGNVVEFDTYTTMINSQSSYIFNFLRQQSQLLNKMELIKNRLDRRRHSEIQRNVGTLRRISGKTGLTHSITSRSNHQKTQNKQVVPTPEKPPERPKGVKLKFYITFIKCGVVLLFVLLCLDLAIAQGLQVLSVWWIASAKTKLQLKTSQLIGIYVSLIVGYGLCIFLSCILITYLSMKTTENLANKITKNVEQADLGWAQKQNKIFMTIILGRDNQQVFTIYSYYQAIFNNFFFYLGILIMNGIHNGYFFIIGVGVLIINWLAVCLYLRSERQLFWAGIGLLRQIDNVLEDNIIGVDSIRSYKKIQNFRQEFTDYIYKYITVVKANSRWILQALSIFSDVTGLLVTFGSAAFAIGNKFKYPQNIAVIGTAVTLSNRLSSLSSNITKDLANLEIQTRYTVNLPLNYGGSKPQNSYDKPEPPTTWPNDNSIIFQRVSFKDEQFEAPLVNQLNFVIEPKSRITVSGKRFCNAVESFMMLINKLRTPTPNNDQTHGAIIIGGCAISQIGRKYIRKYVQLIDHSPFIFSDTLRANIDPFDRYSNKQITDALKKIGLWEEYSLYGSQFDPNDEQSRLRMLIVEGGSKMSHGHKQLINITRVLLQKPDILLCDYAASAVAPKFRQTLQHVLMEQFRDSTVILSTHSESALKDIDQNIILSESNIISKSNKSEGGKNGKHKKNKFHIRKSDKLCFHHAHEGKVIA